MIIQNVRLDVCESDLQSVIDKNLPTGKKLSEVKVMFDGDKILLTGKYEVPIMGAMSIKINIQPEARDSNTVVLCLNFMGLGGMVTGLILKFLDSKIANLGFVSRKENSLFIQLDDLLKYYKVKGHLDLKQLSVVGEVLILEGEGEFSL